MLLSTFVILMRRNLSDFEKYWLDQNDKNLENFPIAFGGDGSAEWFEQFIAYCEMKENGAEN